MRGYSFCPESHNSRDLDPIGQPGILFSEFHVLNQQAEITGNRSKVRFSREAKFWQDDFSKLSSGFAPLLSSLGLSC